MDVTGGEKNFKLVELLPLKYLKTTKSGGLIREINLTEEFRSNTDPALWQFVEITKHNMTVIVDCMNKMGEITKSVV